MKKIILTCWLCLLPVPLLAQGAPTSPHVAVSGQGIVRVAPDILTVHLSVEKLGKEIDAAKQAVDRRTGGAIAAARRIGIDKRDITSTQITIAPRYQYDHDQRQLVGYDVRRSMTLTLRDLDKYEPLLKGLVEAGVNGIDGVSARYSQPEKLRQQAFAKAVNDARAKAARLARSFDASLGNVWSIVELNATAPRPVMARTQAKFASASQASAFEPGTIEITADIRVVFLLQAASHG
ncbi:MAG TPA: SIMPL domain-containing protein [Gammaproteobacteria bacterium]|nr:SIMPL domain-containing protein [Gammaproteobacteria bacterium]